MYFDSFQDLIYLRTPQILLAYGICCLTHLTRERLREFVMSLQVIIYAKQNGAQMATFAATGTRADIDDLRKTMAALGTRLDVLYEAIDRKMKI